MDFESFRELLRPLLDHLTIIRVSGCMERDCQQKGNCVIFFCSIFQCQAIAVVEVISWKFSAKLTPSGKSLVNPAFLF